MHVSTIYPLFIAFFLAILLFCPEMFDHIMHMLYIICRCYAIPSFVFDTFMSTHHCNEQYLVEHKGSTGGGGWIYSIPRPTRSTDLEAGLPSWSCHWVGILLYRLVGVWTGRTTHSS